ncbi:hypothetical protein DV735_g84, partial [Chaetothyriales sp. CBS 134920]
MLPVVAVALLLASRTRALGLDYSWSDFLRNSTGSIWSQSSSITPSWTGYGRASFNQTPTATAPTCSGSVTYIGTVYPTVYVTVTEEYAVAVSASNASLPLLASETLITPLPACQSTIVPTSTSSTITETQNPSPGSSIPSNWTSTTESNRGSRIGGGRPVPQPVTSGAGSGESPESASPSESPSESPSVAFGEPVGGISPIFSPVPYTSTVTVTKKTPVAIITPTQHEQPPVFTKPAKPTTDEKPTTYGKPTTDEKPTTYEKPTTDEKPTTYEKPTTHEKPSTDEQPSTKPNPQPTTPNAGGGATSGQNKPIESSTSQQANNPGENSPPASSTSGESSDTDKEATSPASTSAGTVSPGSPALSPVIEVNDVTISVGASSLVVGTQTIAIPTAGAATIRAGSELFTVEPSSILASGTTVALGPLQQATAADSVPPTTITAAPGVIVVVQGSIAVVDGTTYAIGSGAAQTTISVSGQTIQLGPSGAVLATTTIPASYATPGSGLVVESYEGVTVSVGATVAVIDGTTYAIGSGAATAHVTVDGQSVSIGPGGVAVDGKTTFKPTTVTTTAGTGATSTSNSGTLTSSETAAAGTVESNGSVALRLGRKSGKWIDMVSDPWPYILIVALGLLA